MSKVIPVRTANNRFYRQFLDIFASVPPINDLRPREKDVLAEIMLQNDKFQQLPDSIRYITIFSTDIRKEMRSNLDIKEEIFNNILSKFRKTKILVDNRLNPFLDSILYKDGYELTFKFKEM